MSTSNLDFQSAQLNALLCPTNSSPKKKRTKKNLAHKTAEKREERLEMQGERATLDNQMKARNKERLAGFLSRFSLESVINS